MITYKSFDAELLPQIKALYEKEGWRAYLGNDEMLRIAYERSLWVYGAFDNDRLIGLVRCVGDGQHILLLQDLIVNPEYRGKGIGTTLFKAAWDRYAHVRMFMVVTDLASPSANRLYQRLGMKPLEKGGMVSYFR